VKNDHPFNVLVLAGQRPGAIDPLAKEHGVSHKCLVPVFDQPLIGWVLRTIVSASPDSKIFVSIENPAVLESEPTVRRLREGRKLEIVRAKPNLVDSIYAAAEVAETPLMITTADNVLLTEEAIHSLAGAAQRDEVDALLVMARKEDIQAAHKGGKNRYYEFRDGGFSNCNLFWLNNRRALGAAEPFREGGQFLKVAGRILKTFGLINAILFKLKLLNLTQAFGRLSGRVGVTVFPLVLADGRLAIDVDDAKSKQMVEEILQRTSR